MQVSGSSFNEQLSPVSNVKPQQPSNNTQSQPTSEPTQPAQLNTEDKSDVNNKLTGKQESKFEPSGFKFIDKKDKEYEKSNALVHLAAAVIGLVGGAQGAAYNEKLGDATIKSIDKAADFSSRHGLSPDVDINPFGGMRKKIDQPKNEEADQNLSNQKAREASDKMINQQIANQQP